MYIHILYKYCIYTVTVINAHIRKKEENSGVEKREKLKGKDTPERRKV